ncbi:uncharacterized protein TNCV_4175801 [Trichonephila clavipes]|nr:uncharacterized protein TNCV_4175801 [Trichonephila clavipes]
MKQKQTKNKHSGSARARSDLWTMDMQNRLKSTLEGKISRIETFIESANEETDSVEIKVKLRSLIQLQKNVEELRNNYYAFPNVKDAELTAVDEDLHLLEVRLESLEIECNSLLFCIKQAFLQICLADEHKDAVRFLWSDDEPCVHKRPKLQVYRFNRVNFGVCSSPFLLAATIRHHVEKYKHEFPHTVELLDRNFYVDALISGGNEFEEALQTSRRAKNIMEAAGMDLRKLITNDANLMEQWKKENFNVHPVHETVSLGANGTKGEFAASMEILTIDRAVDPAWAIFRIRDSNN